MVKLMVLVQHSATYLDDAAVREQQEALFTRCKTVMAARAGEHWTSAFETCHFSMFCIILPWLYWNHPNALS